MTETQITFADINVGDKIRSVSPCGTERVGVVHRAYHDFVVDADENVIAERHWTIYRIAPAFTPLPIPNEGQWIRATLRGGAVVEGQVESMKKDDKRAFMKLDIAGYGQVLYLNLTEDAAKVARDIIAWEPIDPPAPPEPDWFGYVGYVTTPIGVVFDVMRGSGVLPYVYTARNGAFEPITGPWEYVLALGTFTAVKP